MGFQAEFNWVIVIKGTLWKGIQEFLMKNPEKPNQPFKVTKQDSRVYPVGHKVFLCDQAADNPVAIVKILSAEVRQVTDASGFETVVTFSVVRQLRRSQIMNLREVLRYLG